jgi:plastocyanin
LRRRLLTTTLFLLAASTTVGVAVASGPTLHGSVGPGFSISLKDASGSTVTNPAAGAYELEVEDESEEHNFHLTGPGVDVATTVDEIGKRRFDVTLQDGRYTFLCDPHALRMTGSFTVGTQTPPPGGGTGGGGTTRPPSAAVGSRLVLTTGPGFAISLRTAAGKQVTRLRPGAYTVVARDRSTAHNARLAGAGVSKVTGVPFVGTKTWKVVLRKGVLTFRCDPHASSMRGTVVVA